MHFENTVLALDHVCCSKRYWIARKHTIDDNCISLLQHARVYTLGKRGQIAHFKVPKSNLEEQGIDIHNAGRGGETTFHGPGQIVIYPVINLRRLGLGARAYVETLEDCMVDACSHYGIHARVRWKSEHMHIGLQVASGLPCTLTSFASLLQGHVPGRTGVWVDDRKIGAVGVKISSGVASHGIAMNINTDLRYFDNIVPCGIEECVMTSVTKETKQHVDIEEFGHLLVKQIYERLKYKNITSIASSELFAPGALAPA